MRTFLALLLLAACCVRAGHPVSLSDVSWPNNRTPNPLLSGLIHAWQLNEGGTNLLSYDRVGSANLAMHNSPTWTTNGSNIGVTFASASTQWMDTPAWQVGETTNFSLAVWFFYTSEPGTGMLVCKEDRLQTWQMQVAGGGFAAQAKSTGGSSGAWILTPPSTNAWHQAVMTFLEPSHPNSAQKLYIDNVDQGSLTSGGFGDIVDPLSVMDVGRYSSSGGGFYLDGTMGPIYIWNRVLTTNEVNQLYANRYLFP